MAGPPKTRGVQAMWDGARMHVVLPSAGDHWTFFRARMKRILSRSREASIRHLTACTAPAASVQQPRRTEEPDDFVRLRFETENKCCCAVYGGPFLTTFPPNSTKESRMHSSTYFIHHVIRSDNTIHTATAWDAIDMQHALR